MELLEIPVSAIKIGEPLAYSIYDPAGQLMLAKGLAVTSEAQRDRIAQWGRQLANPVELTPPLEAQAAALADGAGQARVGEVRIRSGQLLKKWAKKVLLQPAGSARKFEAELLGAIDGRSLIVSSPGGIDDDGGCAPGSRLDVNVFNGVAIHQFPASVLCAYDAPVPHLHLSLPPVAREIRLRRHLRVETAIAATLYGRQGGRAQLSQGRIVDLSVSGAGIETDYPALESFEELRIGFKFALDDGQTLTCNVRAAVRQKSQLAGAAIRYGLAFTELTPSLANMLRIGVLEILLRGL
ncbi:MAG: PilZ domain-containing protein [Burkholderiales bacterium]|nr:PilZ domain-containing protein [Burkholderiales bacterium]